MKMNDTFWSDLEQVVWDFLFLAVAIFALTIYSKF